MSEASENTELDQDEHDSDVKEMSFLEHLEELGWRIIKAAMGVLAAVVVCGFFADWLVNNVVLRPSRIINPPLHLINTIPFGQITFYMGVVVTAALILSSPWIL